jgi:dihydropteroate synthase
VTRYRLRAVDRVLELGVRPWLMGVVNASPDSFSDGGRHRSLEERVGLAVELAAAGADILDIGGESATTGRPPVPVAEEIERVVPLIERVVGELADGPVVSVDTYKPPVARAAVAAGARLVNDVSGLRDPALARVCADTGAALVVMHTAAAPRVRRTPTSTRTWSRTCSPSCASASPWPATPVSAASS